MSGKKKSNQNTRGWILWVVLVLAAFAAGFLILGPMILNQDAPKPPKGDTTETTEAGETIPDPSAEPPYTFVEEVEGVTSFTLDQGLEVTRYGKYIGLYMEDGSDDFVTDVMMIEVKNTGDRDIQYAQITLTGPAGDAEFTLSTLKPGDSMVVLEANRKSYADGDEYTEASAKNVAFFSEPLSLMEDQLLIQPLEGGFNITNISGADITGDIAVYFKDVAGEQYYGGITYVCRIEGGMKDGEIRQIMSANFTDSGSEVVFVRIGQ